jgi:L-2-hydroxyglutarate oxidase
LSKTYDVVIVGGGIIGLASALRLLELRPATRLIVLEKEAALARHQTGHNSGVIHSGLYYKPGSQKALQCREGYRELVEFCDREGVDHEICGKVVVATASAELAPLDELHRRGIANGLTGLRLLGREEIAEIEPHCVGVRGLFVPETGIVDYVAVANRMGEKIRDLGGEIAVGERVEAIRRCDDSVEVVTRAATSVTKVLLTCAGLHSDRLARQSDPELPLRIVPFRGEYYELVPEARHLVNNLIYPVPNPELPFLGVHFTRMIGGGIECGPNAVFAFAREGYRKSDFSVRDTWESLAWPGFRAVAKKYWRSGISEFRRSLSKRAFTKALQRLIPDISEEHLVPGGAGVRAQACSRDGLLLDDFHIVDSGNVLHLCNAPSPAATASLAIGGSLARTILDRLA